MQAVFNELCALLDPGKPAYAPKKAKQCVTKFKIYYMILYECTKEKHSSFSVLLRDMSVRNLKANHGKTSCQTTFV